MKCNKNCKHVLHLVILTLIAALIVDECGCCKCNCKDDKYVDEECKCKDESCE